MADAKTTTLTLQPDHIDELAAIHTKLEYAHSMGALMLAANDFKKLSVHQQRAIDALDVFVFEAIQALDGWVDKYRA